VKTGIQDSKKSWIPAWAGMTTRRRRLVRLTSSRGQFGFLEEKEFQKKFGGLNFEMRGWYPNK
jgi:hypothetical protein